MFSTLENAKTRSASIKAAAAIQGLITAGYLGAGTIFLLPCRPRNELEALGCAGLQDVTVPLAWSVLATGMIALVAVYGLWKGMRWGWRASLLVDLGTAFGSTYYIYKDFHYYTEGDITFGVALGAIPVGWLLLPSVREFYWRC